jgi:hypothetical protein
MTNLDLKLSKNFRLIEFLRSATAERHTDIIEQQYNPPEEVIANLAYLCTQTLQPIRDILGVPLSITSGYRCPALNTMIGSSKTSQHLKGQAVDVQLSATFLTHPSYTDIRRKIESRIKALTGKAIRPDANANFYLFSYVCLRLEHLDIDQVIHEYGNGLGAPGWVHIASSAGERNKRQILALGRYLENGKDLPGLVDALNYGTQVA